MTPKSETNMFDPQDFLAKVGVGKTVVEFQKNQKVFSQGDVADTVFYIQKGKIKLTVMSEQGKEAVVAILEPGQFFWRRLHEWSFKAHRNHDRDGRLPDHRNYEGGDDHRPP